MTAEDIRYRWIDGPDSHGSMPATEPEWEAIERVLEARGWPSLSRATTRIRLAEDGNGAIVGFIVLQLFPHVEPLYVEPGHRGSGIADRLATDMFDFLEAAQCRGWMAIADSPHAEALCRAKGLVRVESPVYMTETARSPAGEKIH